MTELEIKHNKVVEWLQEKKAEAIASYDLQKLNSYTDLIIICEGQADLHVRAIANHLLDMAKSHHYQVLSKEGLDYAHWILLDLGDIVVHVFLPETREYYKIDEFIKGYLKKAGVSE